MTTSPDGSSALGAYGASKRYSANSWGFRDLDLAVPSQSVVALVGPNGAGKSSLIRSWMGFERLTSGTVSVAGIDPSLDRGRVIPLVGYVPQAVSLYRDLSVRDHLALASTLRPGFDIKTAEARLSDLDVRFDAHAQHLSGGQQAQVALALALGTRASIYLLDEPVASLDPLARRDFLRVLEDSVRQLGGTVVLSSHVIADVQQICDRLVVLGDGRKLYDDTIDHALSSHKVLASTSQAKDIGGGSPGAYVAQFPDPAGQALTLYGYDGGRESAETGRVATLEEIVLGYLAFGRQRAKTSALERPR